MCPICAVDALASWSTVSALLFAATSKGCTPGLAFTATKNKFQLCPGASHTIASLPSSRFHPYSVKAVYIDVVYNISNKPYQLYYYIMHVRLTLTLWLPRAPNGALKMPCLINPVALRSTQQPQRSYPVYFAHVLTSVLIYILSIFIASCTDITTTKMSLSCAIALVRVVIRLVGASFWSSQFL